MYDENWNDPEIMRFGGNNQDPYQAPDWFDQQPPPPDPSQGGGYPAAGGPDQVSGQPANYQGLEYWANRGMSPVNLDASGNAVGPNGALAKGWMRTANGYEYLGAPENGGAAGSFNAPSYQGAGAPSLPNLADFKSPDPLNPWTEQFNAPTAQDSINSPGFQFRLGEGLKALERSAAAKGTLLTGGTAKSLNNYAQNQATTQYQQDYNNAYNTYDSRRQNFLTNEANRYNSQRSNNNDQFGIASTYFDQGRANRLDDFNIFNQNRAFDYGSFNDTRNFGRGLNQDYVYGQLGLAALGKPPVPVLG